METHGLQIRPPVPDDAEAIFELLSDPRVPHLLDVDRPGSAEQYRGQLEAAQAKKEAGKLARIVTWVWVLDGEPMGLLWATLGYVDKDGGTSGLQLRTASWAVYLKPDFTGKGLTSSVVTDIDAFISDVFVRHFTIEQFIAWVDPTNAIVRAMLAAQGFDGPINADHPMGLELYRRPSKRS